MNLPKSLIEKRDELANDYNRISFNIGYNQGASDMKDYLIGLLKDHEDITTDYYKAHNWADWLEEKLK